MDKFVKPLRWIGSTQEDLRAFPSEIKQEVGYALHVAQCGGKAGNAKPLKGITTGASVLEVVESFDGNTYRAVYTVRFSGVVYALHAFQKKSTKGIETPKHEIDLIKARLKDAEEHFKKQSKGGKAK